MTSSTDVELVTFGCRLNARESDAMRDLAAQAGLRDLVIVNTCAVTAEAERQARQAIRRLRRARPAARIVVTGCAAQIAPERYAVLPEATHVIGNGEKLKAETWRKLATAPRIHVNDIAMPPPHPLAPLPPSPLPGGGEGQGEVGHAALSQLRTRAYLDVQHGCDHRCTFCVIPYGRGPSRSVTLAEAVGRVRALVQGGAREIVLTGVDLTAWGADLPDHPRLGDLVGGILAAVPELARLRLSSLDPAEIDERLLDLLGAESRVMPHLHLSLQAGDDLILKRMKRRHTAAQALALIERLRRRRDVTLGADLIAGFPTEDEAMFGRSLALVETALDLVHVFPYSPRPGTPASRMPQLPGGVIRERSARLRAAAKTAGARFLARQVGTTARVLVKRSGRKGHAESFAEVALDRAAEPGTIVEVALTDVAGERLTGRVASARAA
jgi:threonylcarbamoyladenosine tRNA methylthiotransferase MtaB